MQLTRQKAIQEHRKMWNWIADTSERLCIPVSQQTYLEKFFGGITIENNCFLCDYVCGPCNGKPTCISCPLLWTSSGIEYCTDNSMDVGYYDLWEYAYYTRNYIEAARLARIIANLPEKEYE